MRLFLCTKTEVSDVENHLKKHFGTDWQSLTELAFYQNASVQETRDSQNLEEEEDVPMKLY